MDADQQLADVSIHAPTRGATVYSISDLTAEEVSIHAPTRGATDNGQIREDVLRGFDPRPHARGDRSNCRYHASCFVSIHAPTRGATAQLGEARLLEHVSIHAPTRGATPKATRKHRAFQSFDPRPHARGDQYEVEGSATVEVSIHAPTRGATTTWAVSPGLTWFRSTPPREGRPVMVSMNVPEETFRSTPPREGRQSFPCTVNGSNRFDPRPHARGDFLLGRIGAGI